MADLVPLWVLVAPVALVDMEPALHTVVILAAAFAAVPLVLLQQQPHESAP